MQRSCLIWNISQELHEVWATSVFWESQVNYLQDAMQASFCFRRHKTIHASLYPLSAFVELPPWPLMSSSPRLLSSLMIDVCAVQTTWKWSKEIYSEDSEVGYCKRSLRVHRMKLEDESSFSKGWSCRDDEATLQSSSQNIQICFWARQLLNL